MDNQVLIVVVGFLVGLGIGAIVLWPHRREFVPRIRELLGAESGDVGPDQTEETSASPGTSADGALFAAALFAAVGGGLTVAMGVLLASVPAIVAGGIAAGAGLVLLLVDRRRMAEPR